MLFIENKTSDVSALGLSVAAGTYFEEKGNEGISHLLEHMIGRCDINGEDFREAVYQVGGVLEASTSVFRTFYYLTSLEKDFEGALELFLKGVFSPDFTERDLRESKESIASELSYAQDVESYKILREMMWKDPSLSKPVTGSRDSILPITLPQLSDYFKKHYNGRNIFAVFLAPKLSEKLVASLEGLPPGEKISFEVDTAINSPGFRVYQERNLKSAITLSFPTKGYEGLGEGRHYFNLAASILSEKYLSDLGSKGLIYDDTWVWNLFSKNGDFILFLEDIEHTHLTPTLNQLSEIIDSWTAKTMDEKDFEIVKNHKILDLKTHTSISEKLVLLLKTFSTSDKIHTYEEAIKVYEKADLKTTLKSFKDTLLTKKPFVVVSAGIDSEDEVGEVERILEKYYELVPKPVHTTSS